MKALCECGCCTGVAASTPQPVHNRPGLRQVRYRSGVYAEFLASMQAALTSAARPALARLTTRDDEDLSIALLDGTACLADLLTFYSERLVNEAYLRTAWDRVSLAELGKLVGYRLRPGVAAETRLAFYVEPPLPEPVESRTSPFRKVRMPSAVTVPAGTQVRSVPGPDELPQVFETAEAVKARPEWNLMTPATTRPTVVGAPLHALYVKGTATNLRPGDLLLFRGSATKWQTRSVTRVVAENELDRTLVTWHGALTKAAPLTAYALRRKMSVFGANAPRWQAMSTQFKTDYGCTNCSEWPDFLIVALPDKPSQDLSWLNAIDLDGPQPGLETGTPVVLVAGDQQHLFSVEGTKEFSRAAFGLSGKVTRLHLDGSFWDWVLYADRVRDTQVYAGADELALVEEPDLSKVDGSQIVVTGHVTHLPEGRTVIVAGGGAADVMTVASAVAEGANTRIKFTAGLSHSYDRATASVFGNVASATNGETVHQILGDGQAAQAYQSFELKHAPLTYLGSGSTLEVRVNDVAWHESATLFTAGPGERVFVTRDTPQGTVEVRTGDGVRGARAPTGQHNVRAAYRKGLGVGGNLPAGALTQLSAPPLGVTGVTNPVPADGGADPDTTQQARQGIPLSTRTLGRAVSVSDYADFARAFPGIAKAHAAVVPVRHIRTIVVTVAGAGGTAVPDVVRGRLVDALHGYGDPLVRVEVVSFRAVSIGLRAKLRNDPDYEAAAVRAAVADRLTATFGFTAREFAQPVQRSEVIATAHLVPGLLAIDLDILYRGTALIDHPRLAAAGPRALPSHVEGAELLMLTEVSPAWLTEMPS